MDDDSATGLSVIIAAIFLLLLFAVLFKIGMRLYACHNADTVKCNFIFCEFTTERTTQESRIERITVQHCSLNGKDIDCDGINITGTP